jgi:dTDP-4-dehydrorhamnose 3,5-epimerase
MQRVETTLPGVCLLKPTVLGDDRGFFYESYHQSKFMDLEIGDTFVQDNRSKSAKHVLRGLHYQLNYPQAKLCSVVRGTVFDVAVDIRKGSPYFGQWFGAILSDFNQLQIYIPAGFAHGFVVLSETAEFAYKCSEFYHPGDEQGILWNDPAIGITWGIDNPILSGKDKKYRPLAQTDTSLLPLYRQPVVAR